jgi:site-specific recombinase XerD
MATDFASALQRFLVPHLAGRRGASTRTIESYRDAFKLLIAWFRDERGLTPGRLTLDAVTPAAVGEFLDWLETARGNSASTRNQRRAAITSFFRWLQHDDPTRIATCQDIAAIPSKKQPAPAVQRLSPDQTRRLLAQPDLATRKGRRDAALLATLYDTGARVQELCDLTVGDIRVAKPATARLTGKGGKTRDVPLTGNTVKLLDAYIAEQRLDTPAHRHHPLFFNQRRVKLTRGGVAWILRKHETAAAPHLPGHTHPHALRHSKATDLYEAGVPLPYIQDILGHAGLATTQIYAKASTETKRRAIEQARPPDPATADLPEWNQDADLLDWLTNL